MKMLMTAVSVIMFTTTFIQEASAQDMSNANTCGFWYDVCRSRGGDHHYCAAKRDACRWNGCWIEVDGTRHCGLSR